MKRPRLTFLRVVWLLACVAVIGLWARSRWIADQWLYLAPSGTTYAFGTHPDGVGIVTSTHGNDLEDLWHPHAPPAPPGWSFSSFRWGTARSVTLNGIGSNDASPGVFTYTEIRHWDPPARGILGAGMATEERVIGPPVPPDPIRYRRTVFAMPFWLILLVLGLPIMTRLRRQLGERLPSSRHGIRPHAS